MSSEIRNYEIQLNNNDLPQQRIPDDQISENNLEVIARQPTFTLGTIGHVAHGKSTLTNCLTNVNTVQHSKEKQLNRTIKIGYANCKIYKCENCRSVSNNEPGYFFTGKSDSDPIYVQCPQCHQQCTLYRHLSITDCPGHADFMRTTLSGVTWMDGAILIVAADNTCPQSQTVEHVQALKLKQELCKNLIVAQNKIDLVNQVQAQQNQQQINAFLQSNTIIPISATKKLNIDQIVDQIARLPIPKKDFTLRPVFASLRSFSTSESSNSIESLQPGVIGGIVIQGIFHLNDIITVRPGYFDEQRKICYPLVTKITSLKSRENNLRFAVAGGQVGLGTLLDPSLTRDDKLIGQIITIYDKTVDEEFPIVDKLRFKFIELGNYNTKFAQGGQLSITVLGRNVAATISKYEENEAGEKVFEIQLAVPICYMKGYQIAVSCDRGADGARLIGYGQDVEKIGEQILVKEGKQIRSQNANK